MHEASLMENIMGDAVRALVPYKVKKVNSITVRAGKLANILPDALEFAFYAQRGEGIFSQAELDLQITPIRAICQECGRTYESYSLPMHCPQCKSNNAKISGGTEVLLQAIDFDEEE